MYIKYMSFNISSVLLMVRILCRVFGFVMPPGKTCVDAHKVCAKLHFYQSEGARSSSMSDAVIVMPVFAYFLYGP